MDGALELHLKDLKDVGDAFRSTSKPQWGFEMSNSKAASSALCLLRSPRFGWSSHTSDTLVEVIGMDLRASAVKKKSMILCSLTTKWNLFNRPTGSEGKSIFIAPASKGHGRTD